MTTTQTRQAPGANASAAISALRERMNGRVVTADDADFDELRMVMAAQFDRRPAAIARVANARDVAAVVVTAREHGMELAVRSGGHDGVGHSSSEGGIVLDLREMRALEIDPDRRTAWAETGLTAADVVTEVAGHGLVIGFGDTGTVGIGGITLGGGIGYQVRKFGLTIDNLLAAEIVTADGQIVTADADNHPDLFWAVRGGGGNFGVATRFLYRLNPMPGFVGGIMVLPATPEVIAGFMRASAEAPEELSTIANVMNCPPMPFVPQEFHGTIVVLAMLGWTGDEAEGERAMAPFRALATPIADMVQPMPYPKMYDEGPESGPDGGPEGAPEAGPGGAGEAAPAEPFRPFVVGRTMFLNSVDLGAAREIVAALEASDAPMRAVQLRALGGAMARVPADATAFAHRNARVLGIVVSFYEGEHDRAARTKWVHDLAAAIDQGVPGAYVNFLEEDGEEGVRHAYPGATWDRLARIKAQYDPTNLFRMNHNVPPAGHSAER